jgi:hypothetical protein
MKAFSSLFQPARGKNGQTLPKYRELRTPVQGSGRAGRHEAVLPGGGCRVRNPFEDVDTLVRVSADLAGGGFDHVLRVAHHHPVGLATSVCFSGCAALPGGCCQV